MFNEKMLPTITADLADDFGLVMSRTSLCSGPARTYRSHALRTSNSLQVTDQLVLLEDEQACRLHIYFARAQDELYLLENGFVQSQESRMWPVCYY